MVDGDGSGNEVKIRWCPIINEYCIGERCVFHSELIKNVGGLQQKMNLCTFNAILMILSEINQKTQAPQARGIQLPRLIKG